MEILNNLDLNTQLQRYIDFSKFVDLLDTQTIFLSRVSYFEDQLEGGLTPTFIMLSNGMTNSLSQIVNIMPLAKPTPEEKAEQQDKKETLQTEYETITYNTAFGKFTHSEVEYEKVFKQHRHWVDVNCWHANKSESMAMWKIYGGTTNSVCIITNVNKLANSVSASDKKLVLSKVHYINHEEDNFQEYHSLAPLLHKSEFYSFENEVRLLAYNPEDDLLSERSKDDAGTVLNVCLNDLIDEIRVAHNAPEWFYKLVQSVAIKYDVSANVVRSKMHQSPVYAL